MQVESTTSLGAIVSANPACSRILLRYGLDFCCGGTQSLAAACAQARLPVDKVIEELRRSTDGATARRWDQAANHELVAHIVDRYHSGLPQDLAQLRGMADKVERVHGSKDPSRLSELALTISKLEFSLSGHLVEEETVLFPQVTDRRGDFTQEQIAELQADHDRAGRSLELIKRLTDNFVAPPEACSTWSNLYARLQAFDAEMREHIHLENNILFPRLLAQQSSMP